jgi:hypothetical protein
VIDPASLNASSANPTSVAVVAGNVTLLADLLDRRLTSEPSPVGARDALIRALGAEPA